MRDVPIDGDGVTQYPEEKTFVVEDLEGLLTTYSRAETTLDRVIADQARAYREERAECMGQGTVDAEFVAAERGRKVFEQDRRPVAVLRPRVGGDPEVIRFDRPSPETRDDDRSSGSAPNPAVEAALAALDRLTEARVLVETRNLGRPTDEELDRANRDFWQAKESALRAIRSAVAGPDCPGEWGRVYHGNRAIRSPDGRLFVLVEADRFHELGDPLIVIVPAEAIGGLAADGIGQP